MASSRGDIDEGPPSEAETVVDSNADRIDYIEERLPVKVPRIGAPTVSGGALIVPTHVAIVRHAAWEPWTQVPLGAVAPIGRARSRWASRVRAASAAT